MAETELLIRAAELSDIPSIMELEQGSIAHPWTKSALEDLIKDPNKICCVGESDGKVVCYAGVETVLDEGNVGNIVTHKEYRGRGFAKALFMKLIEDMTAKGIEKLFLEVESDNVPALSLYGKLGFERYGLRRGYYGQGRDAVLMLKNL